MVSQKEHIRYLLDEVSQILQNPVYVKNIYSENKAEFRARNTDKYVLDVFEYYSKIEDCLSDLGKIIIFLERFPLRKHYEANDINRAYYIKYHLEVFFHKIATLLDVIKKLINAVFEFNLTANKCNWDNLRKKAEIKDSKIETVINKLYSYFKDIIESRNLSTHDAHFFNETNTQLGLIEHITKMEELYKMPEKSRISNIYSDKLMSTYYSLYTKEEAAKIRVSLVFANSCIEEIVEYLFSEFKRRNESKKHHSTYC